jgi:hypothetical protein
MSSIADNTSIGYLINEVDQFDWKKKIYTAIRKSDYVMGYDPARTFSHPFTSKLFHQNKNGSY